jgi:sec-independent protein translocase protein TatB
VFGLGFGELLVLLIVAVVVLGPKDLPRYLRKGGQFAGRMRRLAYEMREKSGIDEVLRVEGIDRDIAEIRRLARGEINGVVAAARSTVDAARFKIGESPLPPSDAASGAALRGEGGAAVGRPLPSQEPAFVAYDAPAHEYPAEGADAYGALPDTAAVYDGSFPASALADDPLYMRGDDPPADANGVTAEPRVSATAAAAHEAGSTDRTAPETSI